MFLFLYLKKAEGQIRDYSFASNNIQIYIQNNIWWILNHFFHSPSKATGPSTPAQVIQCTMSPYMHEIVLQILIYLLSFLPCEKIYLKIWKKIIQGAILHVFTLLWYLVFFIKAPWVATLLAIHLRVIISISDKSEAKHTFSDNVCQLFNTLWWIFWLLGVQSNFKRELNVANYSKSDWELLGYQHIQILQHFTRK